MNMKSILNFLKYNNAVSFILFAILFVTGAVFASSPQLRQSVLAPKENVPVVTAPAKTDASKLLAENFKNYDLALRIDAIKEDAENYYVAYSYRTLEIRNGVWQEIRKISKMEIPKKLLGKRDLKTYLSEQIGQVIDREIAYLSESQAIIKTKSAPQKSSKYASLAGQEIDRDAPSENDIAEEKNSGNVEQKTAEAVAEIAADEQTASEALLSKEEIREMIVAAVAEFLAVDTSMPEDINPVPVEEVVVPLDVLPVVETPAQEQTTEQTTLPEPEE